MTRIILQRHGQSVGNKEHIYLGHTDLGLTKEGIEQAKITAEHLLFERIDAIYSSDLKRAYETAMVHAQLRGKKITTSHELREMFVGDWEGKSSDELTKNLGELFTHDRFYKDFVYPNGEAVVDAAQRLKREIMRIADQNDGKTILIVSHSAAIRAFWFYLSGYTERFMNDRVPAMKNSAYCTLEYENGVLTPLEYDINSHLPPTNVLPI